MKHYHSRYQTRTKPLSVRRWEKRGQKRFILTILLAIFLVYALFTWILPTLIGGLSIFNRFKPAPSTSAPVADNANLAPPVLNIPYEATGSALIAIKGYAAPQTSVEIYLDNNLKATVKTQGDGSFTSDNIPLVLGTNSIWGKTVDDKGDKSLASKPIIITYDNTTPSLTLQSPTDNQSIQGGDKKVLISGATDADKNITVTANGLQLIVDSDGKFSQKIDISDGDNTITVIAASPAGNTTSLVRKVTYQP